MPAWGSRPRKADETIEILFHEFQLPLRDTFTISRSSIDHQPTLIVELRQGGHSGFGEATTNAYYGVSCASLRAAIEPLLAGIAGYQFRDPQTFWNDFVCRITDSKFAQCALDEAAHDLWGKIEGAPVHRLWGLNTSRIPPSNFTIGIDSIEVMIRKLQDNVSWPIYKIKLGTADDLEIIKRLREHTSAVFRVDANCGWTVAQTIELATELERLGVEYIEQPLPADLWQGMSEVYRESALPIIADESCQVLGDVDRCAGHFHGINIKLMKCGGLTPARQMIARARELGLKVMVGCMVESSVGISAIAQLLPLLDYVDMDGAALLSRDIAAGVVVERGICHYPEVNGNGVSLLSVHGT